MDGRKSRRTYRPRRVRPRPASWPERLSALLCDGAPSVLAGAARWAGHESGRLSANFADLVSRVPDLAPSAPRPTARSASVPPSATPALASRLLSIPVLLVSIVALIGLASSIDLFGWLLPDALNLPEFWTSPLTSNLYPQQPDYAWVGLSVLSLLVGVSLSAFAYVLSGVMGPRVQAWAKNSLYQTGKSAIIVLFIFAGFQVVNAPHGSFMFQGMVQIWRAVYFAETVRNTMILEFFTLTSITTILSMLGNITPYLRPGGVIGISFSLSPAFRPIFDSLGIMLSLMSVSVGEWFVHIWLLSFIQSKMLSVMLPLGLFMRCVGPLQSAGDAVIAIVIGFYFVYPFMLNVNAYAIEKYLQAEFNDSKAFQREAGGPATFDACFDATMASGKAVECFGRLQFGLALKYLQDIFLNNVGLSLIGMAVLQFFTGSAVGTVLVAFTVLFTLSLIKASLFYIVVVSLLLPLFNLFVTLTFIKELAGFFGSTLDFSALEKLF